MPATHAARTRYGTGLQEIIAALVDSCRRRRYSQAQIPELVAYANPRSRQAAQGFGSFALYAFRFPLKSMSPLQAFKRIASSFVGLLNAATSHTRPGPEPNAATRGLTNPRFSLTTKFSPGGCRNL
jgi:hypothetical protein